MAPVLACLRRVLSSGNRRRASQLRNALIVASSADRRRGFSVRRQLASLAPLGALWLVGIVLLAAARVQTATPISNLFLDPAHISGLPWYTGALSTFGILVWTGGVVFAAAGAWVARRIGRESASRFLTVGAFATLVLVFDDVFALHASFLRNMIGGSKIAAQLLIVLPTLVWVALFLDDIKRTRSALLVAAFASLGGSVLVDIGVGFAGETRLLVEDGLKFLGILAWSQYFAITSRDIAASAISSALDNNRELRAEQDVPERERVS